MAGASASISAPPIWYEPVTMRHLTDVEIDARIAVRTRALTARVTRLEDAMRALLLAAEGLAQPRAHQPIEVDHALDEARTALIPTP
jgi:hypothetical protein